MADSKAKISLTAEDLTGSAFKAVSTNLAKLKTEVGDLPGKFAQVAIATAGLASITGFVGMINGAIEAKARLRDLSVQTNIGVEALASLGKVGKFSNTALEDIAAGSNKLSKALFSQTEDSKGAAQAIAALGLDFNKFKSLQPEQQMLAIAKALDTFQDGSEKSAAAMLLFGKAGATLLPFLKELSERGLAVTKETAASAAEAKKYEDNLRTLAIQSEEWKKTMVTAVLPTLVDITRELIEGRKAYGGYFAAIFDIGFNIDPFKGQGENIRAATDELAKYQQELAKATGPRLSDKLQARDKKDIQADIDRLTARRKYLLGVQAGQALDLLGANFQDDPKFRDKKGKLVLPDASGGAEADKDARALLKRQFDGQLKLIKDFAEQQKSAYEFANQYLKGVYDDGVLSLSEFFEKQKAVRGAALQADIKSFDDEIAAAEAFKAKAVKPQDREEAENKIKDAVQKRALAVQKASQDNILAAQEEAKAVKQLAFSYYEFLASLKTLQGDDAGASAIRIAKQVQDTQELLTKVGFAPEEAKAKADAYGKLLGQTEALKRAQTDYGRLADLSNLKEKNAQLDAQASAETEIETLRKIGEIRQDALAALGQEVEKARQLAAAVGSPEALLAAEKLTLQFKQAAAEVDPLLMKTREVGKELGDAVANAAEEAILHWQGFRHLLQSIEQQILQIILRSQVTKPLGDYLGNLIGGNGQQSGGGGFLGNLFPSLFGGGTVSNTAFGSTSFAEALSSGVIPLATGTNYVPQDMLAIVHQGEAVVPKEYNNGGGGMTFAPTFNIAGPVDKRTRDQIAMSAFQGAQRALGRNG